ncbi:hypothetical protein ABZ800_12830 [Streptomyces sp. NPDC047813]|uniref:hypothetical protein n=1 Tax=Streptomyces sp. NPDC047813 TaxID=3154608 RepID=UPI0033DBE561
MAVVVRAAAAPLWWSGAVAAGVGAVPGGWTGHRIGVLAGAAVALTRWRRYDALARGAARAGRYWPGPSRSAPPSRCRWPATRPRAGPAAVPRPSSDR